MKSHVCKTGNMCHSLHEGAELACRRGQRITRHWNIKFHLICSNTELCAGNPLPCRNSLASPDLPAERFQDTQLQRQTALQTKCKRPLGTPETFEMHGFPLSNCSLAWSVDASGPRHSLTGPETPAAHSGRKALHRHRDTAVPVSPHA